MVATYWIVRKWAPARVSKNFRRLQLVSAAAYSLGHGGNDAQKTMGIIFAVLISASPAVQQTLGLAEGASVPPDWVVYACHGAMGLGTLLGGWRIVKTMGQKICKLQPVHGFAAETGGALLLYGATPSASPSRRRTRSRARSSASAARAAFTRSSGAWPAASSGRGC